MRMSVCLVGLIAVLAAAGCDKRKADYRHVSHDHVCEVDCHHHHYDGTAVIITRGHRHGPDCGHYWNGRYWVAAQERHERPRGHVCSVKCTHYFDSSGREVVVRGHRHGRDCGHFYDGHRWVLEERRGGPEKRDIRRR